MINIFLIQVSGEIHKNISFQMPYLNKYNIQVLRDETLQKKGDTFFQ
jgi:hypothetical protein